MRAPTHSTPRRAAAFTVIELMLGVAIMTLIVFGLYAVFDQTQKALRGSVQQVDIFEGARAATDLLREDLERTAAGGMPHRANLYSGITSNLPPVPVADLKGSQKPLMVLSSGELYLLHRVNNGWRGIGYWLDFDTNTVDGVRVATLMRYVSTTNEVFTNKRFVSRPPEVWRDYGHPLPADRYYELQPDNLGFNWLNLRGGRHPLIWPNRTNLLYSAPVLGNVVHFKITVFDSEGVQITLPVIEQVRRLNGIEPEPPARRDLPTRGFLEQFELGYTDYDEMFYRFTGDLLPAYVELELGLVEPQIAERLRGFTTRAGAAQYLSRNAGRIHLFRQRIALANAPRS